MILLKLEGGACHSLSCWGHKMRDKWTVRLLAIHHHVGDTKNVFPRELREVSIQLLIFHVLLI